jgi:hypothetical protein
MYFEKQVLLQFQTLPYSSNIKALERIKKEVRVLSHQGHQYVVFVPLEPFVSLSSCLDIGKRRLSTIFLSLDQLC